MATLDDSLLRLSAPFGNAFQRVNSTRYVWDSARRGEDQYVILQRTFSGEGVFTWEGRNWPVPPEHAFIALVPEQSVYYFPSDAPEPWEFSWMNIYGPLAVTLFRDLRHSHGPVLPLPRQSHAAVLYRHLVAQAEKRTVLDPYDASLACYTFLMEWAKQLKPSHTRADPAETVARICRARFREPLNIKELAVETGLSREHLTRLFTGRMGVAPARYLRDLRTQAAREMLAAEDIPLKEIALRCGFVTPRALNRALAAAKSSPHRAPGNARQKATAAPRRASPAKR